MSLANIKYNDRIKIDGEDITEILKGKKKEHKPVFSMHNSTIMSVRKGDWKLFINRPQEYMEINLDTWIDKRAPDGITIIAPFEQATPAQYPGIKPLISKNEIQLYNLKTDPTESNDLADEECELVRELMQLYQEFEVKMDIK